MLQTIQGIAGISLEVPGANRATSSATPIFDPRGTEPLPMGSGVSNIRTGRERYPTPYFVLSSVFPLEIIVGKHRLLTKISSSIRNFMRTTELS